MAEWVLSASILMLVVIVLRHAFHGKIRPGVQYALWGLVLLRLLIPVNLFDSPVSVLNFTSKVEQSSWYNSASDLLEETQGYSDRISYSTMSPEEARTEGTGTLAEIQGVPRTSDSFHLRTYLFTDSMQTVLFRILRTVWIFGSVVTGIWFLAANLGFWHRLAKNRVLLRSDPAWGASDVDLSQRSLHAGHALKVYVAENLQSPCLFGLFQPAVYVTPEIAQNPIAFRHVILHELSH